MRTRPLHRDIADIGEGAARRRSRRRRARFVVWVVAALVGVTAFAGAGSGAAQSRGGIRTIETPDVAPFRMTGIEGYVLGRYWRDDTDTITSYGTSSAQTSDSRQLLTNLSGDFFVMTHNYVYHPNLLLLDLGAGPVLYRQSYSADGNDTTSNRATYNLTARATLLRDKPYRGGLFYERTNDSYPVGPSQSLLTENTRYGFDAALLAPVTPVPINVNWTHQQTQGKGTEQVVDERVDNFNFRAERGWGGLGRTLFAYQGIQDDSKSGSVGLPIQATRSKTNRFDLDTDLHFGGGKEYDLINTVSLYTLDQTANQGAIVDTQQFRFDLNLLGRPSEALQTRARYQFDGQNQNAQSGPDQTTKINILDAGGTYTANPNLSGTFDTTATFTRSTPYSANQVGVSGSVNYRHALPLGDIGASYAFNYFRRDQNSTEPMAQVIGERVTLTGTTWATLRRPQIVLSTVVVSNVPRTQTYVEGRDYALQVIGLATQIQRLVGGSIVDGQEVLVDYDFDTGGTYVLDEFDNSLELRWSYQSYLSIYARYLDMAPHLISGTPTSPLNPVTSSIYGTRADVPFAFLTQQVTLGGFAEWEDRREVIAPYRRTTFNGYAETTLPLIARGGIRLGVQQQNTRYDYTPDQNVNEITYNLRVWARLRSGLDLSIDATRTRDTGSPQVAREYTNTMAKAVWRVRRFLLTAYLARTKESQGPTEQTHTRAQIDLRREF